MRTASTPTWQDIQDKFIQAEQGDASALEWIYEQNTAMAKRANSRMDYLEQKGMDESSGAYKQAAYYLGEQGRERFSTSKRMDMDLLEENMKRSSNFLRAQTSTIRGEYKRRERIYNTLEEHGYIDVPEDPKEERAYKKRMDKFLSSDAFEDLKKAFGSGIISDASENIQQGANVDDLISLYREYEEGEDMDLFTVWDGWIEATRL